MIRGVNLTVNALRKYSDSIQNDVKDAVEESTQNIERKAMALAPSAGESLKTTYGSQKNNTSFNQFIFSTIKNNGFTGEVGIEARATKLAAYIEFGTGASAAGYVPTLPKEFQIIAKSYYINGKGTLIKKPFLLPAYFEEQPKFINKIRSILKKRKL